MKPGFEIPLPAATLARQKVGTPSDSEHLLPLHAPKHGSVDSFQTIEVVPDYGHHSVLIKGLNIMTVAAVFVATVQAQILTSTVTIDSANESSTSIRIINALYLGGLILDIASASLAFLTARWLDRLSEYERSHLEQSFEYQHNLRGHSNRGLAVGSGYNGWTQSQSPSSSSSSQTQVQTQTHVHVQSRSRSRTRSTSMSKSRWNTSEFVFYTWLGFSLFCPLPLLVIGVACMLGGLYVFVWSQQHLAVGCVVSLFGFAVVPMIVGDFYIGRNKSRRLRVIERLSEMQGDW